VLEFVSGCWCRCGVVLVVHGGHHAQMFIIGSVHVQGKVDLMATRALCTMVRSVGQRGVCMCISSAYGLPGKVCNCTVPLGDGLSVSGVNMPC
jgi:hypothetical protein